MTHGPRFPLVRCGLYFQDTARHSDGLAVVAGSHVQDVLSRKVTRRLRTAALPWMGSPKVKLVKTRPGDLVIWDNRQTLHRGTPFDDLRWKRDVQRATVEDIANSCAQAGMKVDLQATG